jgi:predicted component of type VI protein secretion system
MARAIRDLLTIQRVGSGDTRRVSAWIRRQGEASRAAGFARVARLCDTMNDCLVGLRNGERPAAVPVASTLLEVCRTVQLHAEAVLRALRSERMSA